MNLPLGEPHSASGVSQARFLLSALAFNKKKKKKNNIRTRAISSTFPQQFHVVLRGQIISLSSS